MTDEEALFIVVGVDERTGDAVCSVAADFRRVQAFEKSSSYHHQRTSTLAPSFTPSIIAAESETRCSLSVRCGSTIAMSVIDG